MNNAALEAARGLQPTAKNIEALAREFGHEDARWALSQWELRKRGLAKFARSSEMFFDRDGLEMSTHERVADFHASRFPDSVEVLDLTCGLGADLIALAGRGPAVGYEIDGDRAVYARHNLGVYGRKAEVVHGPYPAAVGEYFFADPARRTGGQRKSLRPEDYEPPLSELANFAREAKGAVLKLSPLLDDRTLEELGGQVVFVSFERECREALVLFGECRTGESGTWAVHLESGEWLASTPTYEMAEGPDEWFYEMDPAAIRAHGHGAFDLTPLGDSNGYLTGSERIESPWLRRYRVVYSGRADIKETRQHLEAAGSATPIIKQRGAGLDIDKLRKALTLKGKKPLVLAVWAVGKSLRHTVLESD